MRNSYLFAFLLFPFLAAAQIPAGYYNTATGTGNTLRLQLHDIIRPHTELTYSYLWTAYRTTDVKPNGKLWDVYSDIPGSTPAYEYALGTGQCGSSAPSAEAACYNREHTWPQSTFGSTAPMQTDLFLVMPTDNFVNAQRGDLPYGKAGSSVSRTFTNGSKIGNNAASGAPAGNCFEPIDSFKGDLARAYFYIATCYYGSDSTAFSSWEMANGISFKPWAIQMLLDWHHNDPVSTKEINRNKAAYAIQQNRNPFIDHPEYADCIWNPSGCTLGIANSKTPSEALVIFSNTSNRTIDISLPANEQQSAIEVYNMAGQQITHAYNPGTCNYNVSTSNWPGGLYLVRVFTKNTIAFARVVVE